MKKALKKIIRVTGALVGMHDRIFGDIGGLSGDISGLYGDIGGLYGDIDECDISDEERGAGIDVSDLIGD